MFSQWKTARKTEMKHTMNDKKKKIPMRMCVGCREMHEKRELIRIVKDAQGNAFIDLKGKASGRGAYICRNEQCLSKAIKTKAVDRVLGVTLDEETQARLAEEIK